MLDNDAFEVWCDQLKLQPSARTLVCQIRASEPVRRVGGQVSVSGQYPSLKMGKTIQFESHKLELPAIEMYEAEAEVLEYYDQPTRISLCFTNAKGHSVRTHHVPDFLVLRQASVEFEEWKPEKRLIKLAEQQPNHYRQGENGQWHNLPAEAYLQEQGVRYRLRTEREINWIQYRNHQWLKSYRNGQYRIDEQVHEKITSIIVSTPGIALTQLLQSDDSISTDDVYALIATHQIYADLSNKLLSEATKVQLFRDSETAEALQLNQNSTVVLPATELDPGQAWSWDSKPVSIVQVGMSQIVLRTETGLVELSHAEFHQLRQSRLLIPTSQRDEAASSEGWSIFLQSSPEDLRIANQRYRLLQAHRSGESLGLDAPSERTLRRWTQQFKLAEQSFHWGYVGLLPKRAAQGNRTERISAETWAIVDRVIEEHYETLQQKGKWAVYGILLREWEKANRSDPCPSHITFYHRVQQRAGQKQIQSRQGPRAAYQQSPFYWSLECTTPKHGERPFELCHIDHTELDLELVCLRTGRNLGRPWATVMLDAFSRRVLAAYLSFDPPSYRACMMILRLCVQRFERFPENVVVDQGAEFQSVYFETLLAAFNCTKKQRPAARPRFGSVIERFFGTSHTEFFYTLRGNTQLNKPTRQLTKQVHPKTQAAWTLEELYESFCGYAYEVFDQQVHPALHQSPHDTFVHGVQQSGHRPHQRTAYDLRFQILTLPSTTKGTAKIHPRRGIRIHYLDYWAVDDSFLNPLLEGTEVPVRYDPFDVSAAYAYVQGRWVRCISEYHAIFQGRSEREIKLTSTELRQQQQQRTHHLRLRAKMLAQYLESVETSEERQLQRLRDLAVGGIQQALQNVADLSIAAVETRTESQSQSTISEGDRQVRSNYPERIDLATIQPYPMEELWR